MSTIKQISVLQKDNTYINKDIGVDANNVDIDENNTLADKIRSWDNKVDSIEGKGLSTNDYTTAEKTKLAGLSNYDDTVLSGRVSDIENLVPASASSENKLATMVDISGEGGGGTTNYNDLNNKPQIAGVTLSGNKTLSDLGIQASEQGKGLSTENYTTEEKTKLSGLSNYDDTTISGRVSDIEKVIPSTASEDNKLATMADVSSGSGDTVDYNNLLTLITEDGGQASESIVQVGETYTLGSGAKTNQNNSIQVKCLSVNNKTAIMQTYGVTAGAWPGDGDLTESYNSYWGELSSAISGVKLPTGTTKDNIEPSGAYDVLKTAVSNYSSFGAAIGLSWLGTPGNSGFAYFVYLNGSVGSDYYTSGSSGVCAPYFTLNLSKVLINDGVIELNPSYRDAEFSDLVTKIETKLNNRYTKNEVDTALNSIWEQLNQILAQLQTN